MQSVLCRAIGWVAGAALGAGVVASPAAQATTLGWIDLGGTLLDRPHPIAWMNKDTESPTLGQVIEALHGVAEDDDLEGVVLRFREPALSWANVEELGGALQRIRSTGKRVYTFSDSYFSAELVLASYANEVILQTGGSVTFTGLYAEEMYLADTLAWAGMRADMVQIGDYKGAAETISNSAPSKAWDENFSALFDELYANMRSALTTNRGLSDGELDRAMEQAWLLNGEGSIRAGLIDAEMDRLDVDGYLASLHGEEVRYDTDLIERNGEGTEFDFSNPFAMLGLMFKAPINAPSGHALAIVHIDGAIVDGESGFSDYGGTSGTVGSRSIRKILRNLERDALIKGVVLRIDSPGGSASASESIWQGVQRLAEHKPVWVSVGSMAASGGYYIAVAGEKIYMNPSSIVGSIGVVGGKIAMEGLYEKLKINITARSRGPSAGLFSSSSVWTPAQRDIVRARMTDVYDLFVKRVEQGRPGIDVGRTAEGRLFGGGRAVALGMADRIGGLDDTLTALASEVGLDTEGYETLHYPGPMSLRDFFNAAIGAGEATPQSILRAMSNPGLAATIHAAGNALLGAEVWNRVRPSVDAALLLRDEPVLLTMPRVLIFR